MGNAGSRVEHSQGCLLVGLVVGSGGGGGAVLDFVLIVRYTSYYYAPNKAPLEPVESIHILCTDTRLLSL